MTSNVGLSTPRGSGTSGYVQRNMSLLKPRDNAFGPPRYSDDGADTFKQRQPDRQILEHDRRRQIEVRVLEERDRLEEENERIEEGGGEVSEGGDADGEKEGGTESGKGGDGDDTSNAPINEKRKENKEVLSEEQIEERLDALRTRLTNELEDELAGRPRAPTGPRDRDGHGKRKKDGSSDELDSRPKARKQLKSYQVHELAEAKIEESERLRKALGIKGEGQDSQRDGGRRSNFSGERYRDRDDPRERENRDEYKRR